MKAKELQEELMKLCRRYEECRVEGDCGEEGRRVKKEVGRLCEEGKGMMEVSEPGLLVALLDAYEVTRDEGMLQEVLDVVGEGMERLPVLEESVRLLAYCWYYVEEEECAVKAREIMEELKREGKDVGEAERVLEEMVGGGK